MREIIEFDAQPGACAILEGRPPAPDIEEAQRLLRQQAGR
jgi:hypothetical protein